MSVSLSHCYVVVHDPDAALASYRDALGLELRSDVSSEGFRWVTLSPPGQPDVEVMLVEPHAGRDLAQLPEREARRLVWSGEPSRQITQALLASAFTGCVQAAATADAAG